MYTIEEKNNQEHENYHNYDYCRVFLTPLGFSQIARVKELFISSVPPGVDIFHPGGVYSIIYSVLVKIVIPFGHFSPSFGSKIDNESKTRTSPRNTDFLRIEFLSVHHNENITNLKKKRQFQPKTFSYVQCAVETGAG